MAGIGHNVFCRICAIAAMLLVSFSGIVFIDSSDALDIRITETAELDSPLVFDQDNGKASADKINELLRSDACSYSVNTVTEGGTEVKKGCLKFLKSMTVTMNSKTDTSMIRFEQIPAEIFLENDVYVCFLYGENGTFNGNSNAVMTSQMDFTVSGNGEFEVYAKNPSSGILNAVYCEQNIIVTDSALSIRAENGCGAILNSSITVNSSSVTNTRNALFTGSSYGVKFIDLSEHSLNVSYHNLTVTGSVCSFGDTISHADMTGVNLYTSRYTDGTDRKTIDTCKDVQLDKYFKAVNVNGENAEDTLSWIWIAVMIAVPLVIILALVYVLRQRRKRARTAPINGKPYTYYSPNGTVTMPTDTSNNLPNNVPNSPVSDQAHVTSESGRIKATAVADGEYYAELIIDGVKICDITPSLHGFDLIRGPHIVTVRMSDGSIVYNRMIKTENDLKMRLSKTGSRYYLRIDIVGMD